MILLQFFDNLAFTVDEDVVGDPVKEVFVMAGDEDGLALVLLFQQEPGQKVLPIFVEGIGWLIKKEDLLVA